MNKSLFETRQKSIAHYEQQIKDLTQTISEIESVKKDVVESLIEFFPFEMGDIIINGTYILKVKTIARVSKQSLELDHEVPDGNGSWTKARCTRTIYFDGLKDWKKIN